jgi:hypothetical protein
MAIQIKFGAVGMARGYGILADCSAVRWWREEANP